MNHCRPGGSADRTTAWSATGRSARQRRRWATRAVAAVTAGGLALSAAACGSSTSATTTSTAPRAPAVLPPAVPAQNCSYVLNGTVPPGEPLGVQTGFPSFTPNQAAGAAIGTVDAHGGTGLVTGITLPAGVKLFAGPDTGQPSVTSVPAGRSLLAEDPLLWTTGSGAHWLAFFVACGGQHLFWVDVHQIGQVNPSAGAQAKATITTLQAAPAPYTQTGKASTLPLKIENHQIVWNVPPGPYALVPPVRGQLLVY